MKTDSDHLTSASSEAVPGDAMRANFEAFVRSELGDVAVADRGRYISPKIQNYWRTWQAAIRSVQ
jgi:hypothetical protein